MEDFSFWPTVFILASLSFSGAIISSIAGFGGGMLFLPFLAAVVGPDRAVPVITIMMLLGTPFRAFINRQYLRWPIISWYSIGTTFGAIIGALVFLSLPVFWLLKVIGGFLIVAMIFRHVPGGKLSIKKHQAFVPIGVCGGFVGAVVGGMGPFISPFFLAAGLTRGAFVGTVAACAVWMHIVKLFVYGEGGILDFTIVQLGIVLGLSMILGTVVGTKVLRRLNADRFALIVEILLVVIGVWFLIRPTE